MLNIIQNTIGAIRRVGESVVRAGLKMWLPFTKSEPLGENLVVNGDFTTDSNWYNVSGTGWEISGSSANHTGVTNFLEQNTDLLNGVTYIIQWSVTNATSGTLGVSSHSGDRTGDDAVSVNGNYKTFLVSNGNNLRFYASGNASISSVSVEEYAQETPDISGNDNNAILKTGKALVFDGNDSVETSFPSSKTIKTIAFWIYPTHSAQFETLFNLGITNIPVSPLGDRVIQLNHLTISNKSNYPLNFDVYIDGVYRGETNYNGDNPTLSLNQWQRVVLVNSNGTSTVNDTFDVAYTGSGSHGRFKMSDLQIYGAEFTTDDIAYDYANPQSLVTDNASSSVTLNDLHAWWHMSEGSGTIAFDSAPLLGKELVVNGDFEDGISGWTPTSNAHLSVNNGKLRVKSEIAGFEQGYQYVSVEAGKTYRFIGDVYYVSGALGLLYVDGLDENNTYHEYGLVNVSSTNTTNSLDITFTALNNSITIKAQTINTTSGLAVEIDNISVKEVYNIDGETYDGSALGATYDDAQERIPQLGMMNWSKGSNLIEYSEDFSNSYWSKGSVTLESGYLAPDGTLSAYKVTADESYANVYRLFSGVGSYYRSIWAKTTSGTGTVSLMTRFDSTGSIFTITNEWQRFTINSADSLPDYFYVVDFRGGNLDEVVLWGAQLENSDSASAYRRTDGTAVTDVTLISCATDSQKDILGNAVRVKGSGFNLDGTGYAEVLNNASINPTTEISLGCWVYLNSDSNKGIVAKWEFNALDYMLTKFSSNIIRFYIGTIDLEINTTQSGWVFIVGTYDGTFMKLYSIRNDNVDVNGNVIVTKTTKYYTGGINNSSNNLEIGRYYNDAQFSYTDKIDDVILYDVELDEEEILQIYNATKSGHNN